MNIRSPSFPQGLENLRSETEARNNVSVMDVIRHGAAKLEAPKRCPWCGEDPPLARMVRNRFIVGCESDSCPATPEVSADTLEGAWLLWNKRS